MARLVSSSWGEGFGWSSWALEALEGSLAVGVGSGLPHLKTGTGEPTWELVAVWGGGCAPPATACAVVVLCSGCTLGATVLLGAVSSISLPVGLVGGGLGGWVPSWLEGGALTGLGWVGGVAAVLLSLLTGSTPEL